MIISTKHESEVIYMNTFLDLLVIVFMVLVTVSLFCICLMFLTRNLELKKISYYILSILCIYAGYIGIRIGDGLFLTQTIIGGIICMISIVTSTMILITKDYEQKFKVAQFIISITFIIGILNAFI